MLEIEYKGANSVIITGKDASLWIDPLSNPASHKPGKSTIVYLGTEQRFMPAVSDDALHLEGPGEYETGPFWIHGVAAQRHIDTLEQGKAVTIYRVDVGEFRVGILGNIDPNLSEDQLEAIGTVDFLVIPVGGGGYTLDATTAAKIVRQVEPNVVVPVHYADQGVSYEVPQDSLETFIHELGAPVETLPKVKMKNTSSIPQTLTVYRIG